MIPHNNYFEGIMQLRNVEDSIVEFVINELSKNETHHIAKIKKVTNGTDIYLSPQKAMRSLGNKLQKRFGGQLTVSTKLHTKSKQTSKDLYRVNMLFRSPKFKKGDVVEYKGDKIKIVSMHKKVFAKDIKTGKKLNINFKDLL
jgi:NMD protein affecting ribosome stability and mRNA decay